MIEQLVLGTIQGIAEWLPVSSEGLLVLTQTHFFGQKDLSDFISQALFLHLGTFLAALVYFRKEIITLPKNKKLVRFLILTTLISGLLAFSILKIIDGIESQFLLTGKTITLITGLLLLITGFLQKKSKSKGKREQKDLKTKDGLILGLIQGLAALPGLSRSGSTVAILLLLGFSKTESLKLSFLMSLPIVFLGNLVLNLSYFSTPALWWGLLASFVFGLLTIHLLLKLAQKINFGKFVIFLGLLTVGAAFL